MSICYFIIALYAIWTCNSITFDDGVLGKLAYCALALSAIGLAYNADGLHTQDIFIVSVTVIFVRSFFRHAIYPHFLKKIQKIKGQKNG